MKKIIIITTILFSSVSFLSRATDLITAFSNLQCEGSDMPYQAPGYIVQTPDSLVPVMINHVGRHGSRYLTDSKSVSLLEDALEEAIEVKTITRLGRELYDHVENILEICTGNWGALDTLGKIEERDIALRMQSEFGILFNNGRIRARSSYVPRAIMSMYEFTHEIASLNERNEIVALSGRSYDDILRFFDCKEQKNAMENPSIRQALQAYAEEILPYSLLSKFFGNSFSYDGYEKEELLMAIYSVVAGAGTMSYPLEPGRFISNREFNALWSYRNLRHYLQYSTSCFGDIPAQLSIPLLKDFILTTDSLIAGCDIEPVQLRFGHAETLIPFLALLQIPGCCYVTQDLTSVNRNWLDFDIVPMAANFRMILFREKKSGRYYVRFDLNEQAVPLVAGSDDLYLPWEEAKNFMMLRAGLWF